MFIPDLSMAFAFLVFQPTALQQDDVKDEVPVKPILKMHGTTTSLTVPICRRLMSEASMPLLLRDCGPAVKLLADEENGPVDFNKHMIVAVFSGKDKKTIKIDADSVVFNEKNLVHKQIVVRLKRTLANPEKPADSVAWMILVLPKTFRILVIEDRADEIDTEAWQVVAQLPANIGFENLKRIQSVQVARKTSKPPVATAAETIVQPVQPAKVPPKAVAVAGEKTPSKVAEVAVKEGYPRLVDGPVGLILPSSASCVVYLMPCRPVYYPYPVRCVGISRRCR